MAANPIWTRPIHLQVRDVLAERIASGDWRPGQAIPSAGELAREMQVSPGTMRKALSVMESEHLITRRQGRGTFVDNSALAGGHCSIRGIDGECASGRIEAAEIEGAPANEMECRRLRLPPGDPVWRLQRVRVLQDQASMFERISLPARLFPQLEDRIDGRIVFLAQQCGVPLGLAEERISIGAASHEAARALDIAPGSPVMVLDRVVRTIDGRPVEWRVGQCELTGNCRTTRPS